MYLLWLDYLAVVDKDDRQPPSLAIFSGALEKEGIDMSLIRKQLCNREPADWSYPVFASEEYIKSVLKKKTAYQKGSPRKSKN
jgi:hypothetical protein